MPLPTIAYTASVTRQTNFEHPTTGQGNVQTILRQLDSGDIANASGVAGASVTNALNTLAGLTAPFAPLSALLWVDKGTAVPTPSQTGSIAAPNKTVQGGVDASPSTGAALFIVGSDYSAEAVSVVGASKRMAFLGTDATAALIGSITAAATFRCERVVVTNALSSSDGMELVDSSAGGSVTTTNDLFVLGHTALGADNSLGSIGGAVVVGGLLTAANWFFSSTVDCAAVMTADGCTFLGPVTAAGATLSDCTVFSTLDLIDLNFAVDCIFGSAVTCTGSAIIQGCTFSGNLTVTGVLNIDSYSYLQAVRAGHTITAGTLNIVDAVVGPTQSQLAWNPAISVNSNVLTVLPANHPPGIYSINVAMVLQALATLSWSNATGNLSVNGVSAPLRSINTSVLINGGVTGRNLFAGSGTAEQAAVGPITVFSAGVNAVTFQMTTVGTTGTPSIDLYASASLVGR